MTIQRLFVDIIIFYMPFYYVEYVSALFSLQPGSIAISGENTTLICNTNSSTSVVYIYKTDTKNFDHAVFSAACSATQCIGTNNGYQTERTENSVHIIIHALDRSRDEKWWTCAAEGAAYQFYLTIYVQIQNLYLEPAADSYITVIENTSEPVICITSAGKPESNITWYKHQSGTTKNLGEGDSVIHQAREKGLKVTKSIKHFFISRHDPPYSISCSALNIEGSRSIITNRKYLKILYPAENMTIFFSEEMVSAPHIDVMRGETITLFCLAVSNPPVEEFSWSLGNHKGNNLTISGIQASQKVNCTAKNTMTSSSGITVIGYNSIIKEINVLYEANITGLHVVVGNTSAKTNEITVAEADSLSIICQVDSNPDSTIKLFQENYALRQVEQSLTLVYNISSVRCIHTSEYSCEAWNGIGKNNIPAVRRIQLNVICKPRPAGQTDLTVKANLNTQAHLSLTILAYPIPSQYVWYRNNSNGWEHLTNSTRKQMRQELLRYTLTIRSVKPDDYGEYKLTVNNGIKEPLNMVFVLQPDNPEIPKQFKITQESDGRLTVSWLSGSNGGSKQSFYIQIRDASSSDWFEVEKEIEEDGMLQKHTKTLPRLFASPMYIRMYSKSSYGQSTFTNEVYIPGQEIDNRKEGFLIATVVLAILLVISIFLLLGMLMRRGFIQTACRRLRRLNEEKTHAVSQAQNIQMSTAAETHDYSNAASEHMYDDIGRRDANEHAYGSLG